MQPPSIYTTTEQHNAASTCIAFHWILTLMLHRKLELLSFLKNLNVMKKRVFDVDVYIAYNLLPQST